MTIHANARALRRLGLGCVLVATGARIITTDDPLPGWSVDPYTTMPTFDGLGPAGDLFFSALAILGLGCILVATIKAKESLPRLWLGLAAIGCIPVLVHSVGADRSLEHAVIGFGWVSIIASGLAAMIACRHETERRLVLGLCAGLAGPLAIKAAIQVYSEHPMMVEAFKANRDAIFASHGWNEASATARVYERRLLQPEASAWFAMSNVYASMMAGCVVLFATAGLALWDQRNTQHHVQRSHEHTSPVAWRMARYQRLGILVGLIASVGGLIMALPAGGALPKGAIASAAIGLLLLGAVWLLARSKNAAISRQFARLESAHSGPAFSGAILGVGLILFAIGAIIIRGLIGTHMGELSLLFRWFYIEAAVKIAAAHPLWGVGPDGFQNAYLLFKNPLNPEEIARPHSVLFDDLASLGLLGGAWVILVLAWAAKAGESLVHVMLSLDRNTPTDQRATPSDSSSHAAGIIATMVVVILICMGVSISVQVLPFARSVPDAFGMVLLDGVSKLLAMGLLWLGLAAALAKLKHPLLWAGLAISALVLLIHSQIELTMADSAAGSWVALLVGAAAAVSSQIKSPLPDAPSSGTTGTQPIRRSIWRFVPPGIALMLGVFVVALAGSTRSWERSIKQAARLAWEPTAFAQRFVALTVEPITTDSVVPDDSPRRFVDDLHAALGRPVAADPATIETDIAQLRALRLDQALDRLQEAARSSWLPSRGLSHALVRLALTRAMTMAHRSAAAVESGSEQAVEQGFDRARDLVQRGLDHWPGDPRFWRQLAQIELARAQVRWAYRDGTSAENLASSLDELPQAPPRAWFEAMQHAAALDPLSCEIAYQLALGSAKAGDLLHARQWATKAITNHNARYLDPLAGLSSEQLQRLHELLSSP